MDENQNQQNGLIMNKEVEDDEQVLVHEAFQALSDYYLLNCKKAAYERLESDLDGKINEFPSKIYETKSVDPMILVILEDIEESYKEDMSEYLMELYGTEESIKQAENEIDILKLFDLEESEADLPTVLTIVENPQAIKRKSTVIPQIEFKNLELCRETQSILELRKMLTEQRDFIAKMPDFMVLDPLISPNLKPITVSSFNEVNSIEKFIEKQRKSQIEHFIRLSQLPEPVHYDIPSFIDKLKQIENEDRTNLIESTTESESLLRIPPDLKNMRKILPTLFSRKKQQSLEDHHIKFDKTSIPHARALPGDLSLVKEKMNNCIETATSTLPDSMKTLLMDLPVPDLDLPAFPSLSIETNETCAGTASDVCSEVCDEEVMSFIKAQQSLLTKTLRDISNISLPSLPPKLSFASSLCDTDSDTSP